MTIASDRLQPCDLVMKGGITSGVVYPPAVLKLSETYRFCRIGGTSAGAIAAALTAAAEYGRDEKDGSGRGGFDRLTAVSETIGSDNFIRNLFQPSRKTAPLMQTAIELFETLNPKKKDAAGHNGAAQRSAAGEDRVPEWKRAVRFLRRLVPTVRRHVPNAFRQGFAGGMGIGFLLTALVSTFVSLVVIRLTDAVGSGRPSRLATAIITVVLAILIGYLCGRIGGLLFGVRELWRILSVEVPANHFGMCNGSRDRSDDGRDAPPVLTDWLAEKIDELAGPAHQARNRPLTFKDLERRGTPLEGRGTTLKMVTTNLSQNQPYALPFSESYAFLFKLSEMELLFPPAVSEYMRQHGEKLAARTVPPEGYFFLPRTGDLPVVVGMRLSLSFPVLISTVPLYTIKDEAFKRRPASGTLQLTVDDLQRNLFSDGGISSNFPIHFFDRWLPTHPTFGINLRELPPEAFRKRAEPGEMAQDASVEAAQVAGDYFSVPEPTDEPDQPPDAGGDDLCVGADERGPGEHLRDVVYVMAANARLRPSWKPIDSVRGMFGAIWSTAQNYHDNNQAELPSYRERIVHVCFSKEEGGLNLAMDAHTIAQIKKKGAEAGRLLSEFKFDHHKWVRLLVLLAELEIRLGEVRAAYKSHDDFLEILAMQRADADCPYRRSQAWADEAAKRLQHLVQFAEQWEAADREWKHKRNDQPFFPHKRPKPAPALRIAPEL